MLLSIFDLDDSSGKPLCSFGQGEHVIGRGAPLKCLDKRISRKHAQIEVSEDAATITAKHEINPCFYRAAAGKHISILKYNIPVELTSGDKFGFFPDKHWFQIKITTNIDNLQNNGTSLGVDENLNESHESDLSYNNLRNQETTTINDSNLNESESVQNESTSVQNESTSVQNESTSVSKNNIEVKIEEVHVENEENLGSNVSEECVDGGTEKSTENIKNNVETNEQDTTSRIQIQRNEDSTVNVNNFESESITDHISDSNVENNADGLALNVNNDARETGMNESHNNDSSVEAEPNLLLHPNNIYTDDRDLSPNRIRSIHSAETTLAEDESVPEIDEDMQISTDNNPPQDVANLQIKQEPDDDFSNVKVKQEVIDNDDADPANVASTSGTAGASTQKVYRDRCWYGASCYRKNDDHRLKFSHPNDNDYDTDPEDTRPSCSFGRDCYRRNKDHRRNFKHSQSVQANQQPTAPPSPQKKTKRTSPTKTKKRKNDRSTDKDHEGDDGDGLSQSNIVGSKRRRNNKTLAESPLDDYDLNDPFFDDSDDEFQIDSDASESEDDSQSQNI